MGVAIPKSRPQMKREVLEERVNAFNIDKEKFPILFIGVRGYYLDTLGEEGENDRGIYDDAMFIMTNNFFLSFNANTDPSVYRQGIATLKKGWWPAYKFDLHRGQYLALCQRAGAVTVHRDDVGDETGWFGINIHKGSYNSTSSLGCQTIHPDQWEDFIDTGVGLAEQIFDKNWKRKTYGYLLLDERDYR
jgi:lysozyme